MKKVLRTAGKCFLAFLTAIGGYLLCAAVFSGVIVNKDQNQPGEMAVYLSSNGFHTDLVMPVKTGIVDWGAKLPFADTESADDARRFVAVGWGNADFFINIPSWSELQWSIALKAALGMGPSALHVTFIKTVAEDAYCRKITLSSSQYRELARFIDAYVTRDSSGNCVRIAAPHTENGDVFYAANGRLTPFFTCNTWVNAALKSAGLRACLWTPFSGSLLALYTP